MRNLITDIPGLRVGHAADAQRSTGVTALVFDAPVVAAVDVRGGGPGTRETALLEPVATVERIDAIALSGGSAFGLEAAAGIQAWLAEQGRGYAVRSARVPIVPGAILFDLLNGPDKDWGRYPPYRELGYEAAARAAHAFDLGSVGAGLGANTVALKGGSGSASAQTADGFLVGAIAVVNAAGSVTVGGTAHFWAAPFEEADEFGGIGLPSPIPKTALVPRTKAMIRQSTTLAVIATDAHLSKAQTQRLAIMAQTGMARAIYPVHTPLDGDVVFAVATGQKPLRDELVTLTHLGAAAANVLARSIARAIYEATPLPFTDALPSWKSRFG